MGGKDYYRVLEVHPEASSEIIKKAYQVLALRYHPDRHNPARQKWAGEKFKELSEAYQVLRDPAKRRKYDTNGYSEQLAGEEKVVSARVDEESYFYYRMGLEHYKRAQKKKAWRILLGVAESDLKRARDDFATVLEEYPDSKYAEDAHFYYICTLMEKYQYGREFLKETEEEFTEFLDEYPRGKWAAEAKMRFAKFYLFKKRDYSKAEEFLTDIVYLYGDTDVGQEAEVLLEYVQNVRTGEEKRD